MGVRMNKVFLAVQGRHRRYISVRQSKCHRQGTWRWTSCLSRVLWSGRRLRRWFGCRTRSSRSFEKRGVNAPPLLVTLMRVDTDEATQKVFTQCQGVLELRRFVRALSRESVGLQQDMVLRIDNSNTVVSGSSVEGGVGC